MPADDPRQCVGSASVVQATRPSSAPAWSMHWEPSLAEIDSFDTQRQVTEHSVLPSWTFRDLRRCSRELRRDEAH